MTKDHLKCFHFIASRGVALLFVGGILSTLAEVMTNPRREQPAYILSLILLFFALIEPMHLTLRSIMLKNKSKRFLNLILINVILLLSLFATVAGFNIRLVSSCMILILAAFLGLFWSTWCLHMAYKVCTFPVTAKSFAVLGAITLVLGAILTAQAHLNSISAVTAVACYCNWIGAELLMMTPVLFWNWRGMDSSVNNPDM